MKRGREVPWWKAPAHEVARRVCQRAEEIQTDHGPWYKRCEAAYCLYGDAGGLTPHRRAVYRQKRNVIAEAIDSLASELTQRPTRVTITTTDADFMVRERAKRWTWYADALAIKERLGRLEHRMTRDALIAGFAAGVIVDGLKGPRPERIHPHDALLDDGGCVDVEPPEFGIKRRLGRHTAARLWPDHADAILDAPPVADAWGRDVVLVYEMWMADERHVIALAAAPGKEPALLDEEWEGRAPWFWLNLIPATSGFRGESLVLRMAPLQAERNALSGRIQAGERSAAVRLVARKGAFQTGHLENEQGTVLWVNGDPSTAVMPLVTPAVHPEVYQRENYLTAAIFDAGQANELFAQGEKPPGLSSGKALMQYKEIRSRRHQPMLDEIGLMRVAMTEEQLRAEVRWHERDPSHRVLIRASGTMTELPVAEIAVDLESLQVRAQPSSMLPIETMGLIELLQGLVQDGLLDMEGFYTHLPTGDFDAVRERVTAPERAILADLDAMLWDGQYRAPEPYYDHARALRIGRDKLQQAKNDGAPEDRLKLLRVWLDRVAFELSKNAPRPAMPLPLPSQMAPDVAAVDPGPLSPPPPNGAPFPAAA